MNKERAYGTTSEAETFVSGEIERTNYNPEIFSLEKSKSKKPRRKIARFIKPATNTPSAKIVPMPIREDEPIEMRKSERIIERYNSGEEDSVSNYFNMIARYPILNRRQEEIVFLYLENGGTVKDLNEDFEFKELYKNEESEMVENLFSESKDLRQLIINSNLRLVVSIAKRFKGKGLSALDLYQEGVFGLFRAIDKFEVEKGFKFSTYATYWVWQSIQRAIVDKGKKIRISVSTNEAIERAEKRIYEFLLENERYPTARDLRGYLKEEDLGSMTIDSLLRTLQNPTVGAPVSSDAEIKMRNDRPRYLKDTMQDESENVEENALELIERENIKGSFNVLTDREKRIIIDRFWNGKKLEEIGDEMGVTRERVRQIQAKALQKLKKKLEAQFI